MTDQNQEALLEFLQREFSITFDDKEVLVQAFTRRSHFNEPTREVTGTSEEMAFLGDAVLKAAVSESLFTRGVRNVGVLTELRKELESKDKIAEIVEQFHLARFLDSSQGEKNIADSNATIIS